MHILTKHALENRANFHHVAPPFIPTLVSRLDSSGVVMVEELKEDVRDLLTADDFKITTLIQTGQIANLKHGVLSDLQLGQADSADSALDSALSNLNE